MTNNNQQPPQENPNNQFSNNEPMTFAQKVEYVKSTEMTNNKQQTAVEWLENELERVDKEEYYESIEYINARKKAFQQAKEMDKEQKIRDFTDGYLYRGEQLSPWLIDKWYEQTYGGGEQ